MKKLLLLSLTITSALIGMEEAAPAQEIDLAMMQAHELKALKSKDAPFHEKNSFLDAYMNPSNFTEVAEGQVSFPHHKYAEVKYTLSWDSALSILQDAALKSEEIERNARLHEEHPLLTILKKYPLQKFTQAQKYQLQLLFFTSYRLNEDLEKKEGSIQLAHIALNRTCYKNAFDRKDPKKVIEYSMTELRTMKFENLSKRIGGMRLLTAIRTGSELGMASFVIETMGQKGSNDCIIS